MYVAGAADIFVAILVGKTEEKEEHVSACGVWEGRGCTALASLFVVAPVEKRVSMLCATS